MLGDSLSSFIRQAPESSGDPNFLLATVLAIATSALAIITFFYMRETKKMRIATENILKGGQKPIFAIEPVLYDETGDFHAINLVNHGQTATDILAICYWLDSESGSGSGDRFYILSLSKDGRAILNIPALKIIEQKKYLKIEITCKNSQGDQFATTLIHAFDKLKDSNTKIAYQYSYEQSITGALKEIRDTLNELTKPDNKDKDS